MSEFSDTSYYEIALTNRQVVIAFVILLTMVLAVFLCGVWVGQSGQQRLAHADPAEPAAAAAPPELANLEEFKFFEEQAKKENLDKPNLGSLLDKPKRDTTLAQDVGAGSTAGRDEPASSPAVGAPPPRQVPETAPPETAPPETAPPETAPQTVPPPRSAAGQTAAKSPARTEPAAATTAADGFVVQVFSTHDEPQARKLLKRLEGLGHRAFLSTIDVGGQTMFRVRIGPFAERESAEQVKGQVRNQLKLDPWVTAASN